MTNVWFFCLFLEYFLNFCHFAPLGYLLTVWVTQETIELRRKGKEKYFTNLVGLETNNARERSLP